MWFACNGIKTFLIFMMTKTTYHWFAEFLIFWARKYKICHLLFARSRQTDDEVMFNKTGLAICGWFVETSCTRQIL